MQLLAIIGALLLAVPASAQTPTPTPVTTFCALPTPTATPAAEATGIPTTTPTAAATATPTATPTTTPKVIQHRTVGVFLIDTTDGTHRMDFEETDDKLFTNGINEVQIEGDTVIGTSSSGVRARYLLGTYDIIDLVRGAPDIFGPYESTTYLTNDLIEHEPGEFRCPYPEWSADALALAVEEEDLTQEEVDAYDHLMFILPYEDPTPEYPEGRRNSCNWGALGIPGGKQVWIQSAHAGVMAHELGHNFYFLHTSDRSDLMGSGPGFNAVNLLRLNVLPSSEVVEITSPDTVVLLPIAIDPYDFPGTRVIKIPVDVGDDYYFSFRDDSNVDQYLRSEWKFQGFISRWDGSNAVEYIGTIGADDIFIDENANFKIEVTDISQGVEHLEMTMEIIFPPQLRKVAAILIETSDCEFLATSQEVDERIWTNLFTPVPAEASDRLLISGRERWLAASYGILDLARDSNPVEQSGPDVFGPYEVAGLCTDECEYDAWGQEALQAARVTYPELIDYDHIIHYMPGGYYGSGALNNCSSQEPGGWGGLGQNGGKWVWVNSLNAGLIMHELGHNFNVQANDDPTDMMGTNDVVGLNAPHMLQLEFLLTSEVVEVTSNSTVTLLPLYVDPYDFPGSRVVKILAPTGDPYYISFRDDSNVDINLRVEDQFAGFVHQWDGDNVVSDGQKIKTDDIFTDPEKTFQVEVTDISQGAQHWEMEIEVTFLPTGLIAYQEPS
jgi:hypothetical protein